MENQKFEGSGNENFQRKNDFFYGKNKLSFVQKKKNYTFAHLKLSLMK